MKKNYYEILEVDKNASNEIIRKAYNTLAKKYHPDLQPKEKKDFAEEKLKLINEAYEIIGNESLRKQYDTSLLENFVPIDVYNEVYIENQHLKNKIKNLENQAIYNNYQKRIIHSPKLDLNETSNYKDSNYQEFNKQHYNNYNLNQNFSNSFKNIIALFLTLLILWILWNIPFVNNLIKNILSF